MEKDANILVTGGSGLLGTALKKLIPEAYYPSHAEFCIPNYASMWCYTSGLGVKTLIHLAAFTSPPKIDANPEKAIIDNIQGTCSIVQLCMEFKLRLIYMSTDYVFSGEENNPFIDESYQGYDPVYPVNKYAWSKLGGECAVQLYDNYVIIRGTFGPDIFPYDKAFTDQYTSKISVTEMAQRIVNVIRTDYKGILHIGDPVQSIYNYAKKSKPEVGKMKRNEVDFNVPFNTGLNTQWYDELMQREGIINE